MESNPYSSPSANLFGVSNLGASEAVADTTIHQLQGTKPWARLVSVINSICAILMIVFAGLMIVTGGTAFARNGGSPLGGGFVIFGAIFYLMLGFLNLYPALKLGAYASAISRLVNSRSRADLQSALNAQRSFWKFSGIMAIVGICLVLLVIFGILCIQTKQRPLN